jgi:hypothetical protein
VKVHASAVASWVTHCVRGHVVGICALLITVRTATVRVRLDEHDDDCVQGTSYMRVACSRTA